MESFLNSQETDGGNISSSAKFKSLTLGKFHLGQPEGTKYMVRVTGNITQSGKCSVF